MLGSLFVEEVELQIGYSNNLHKRVLVAMPGYY
jgi:hypothetical protein